MARRARSDAYALGNWHDAEEAYQEVLYHVLRCDPKRRNTREWFMGDMEKVSKRMLRRRKVAEYKKENFERRINLKPLRELYERLTPAERDRLDRMPV